MPRDDHVEPSSFYVIKKATVLRAGLAAECRYVVVDIDRRNSPAFASTQCLAVSFLPRHAKTVARQILAYSQVQTGTSSRKRRRRVRLGSAFRSCHGRKLSHY